jgi:hypothetical protein
MRTSEMFKRKMSKTEAFQHSERVRQAVLGLARAIEKDEKHVTPLDEHYHQGDNQQLDAAYRALAEALQDKVGAFAIGQALQEMEQTKS